jgi:hypothetical protein
MYSAFTRLCRLCDCPRRSCNRQRARPGGRTRRSGEHERGAAVGVCHVQEDAVHRKRRPGALRRRGRRRRPWTSSKERWSPWKTGFCRRIASAKSWTNSPPRDLTATLLGSTGHHRAHQPEYILAVVEAERPTAPHRRAVLGVFEVLNEVYQHVRRARSRVRLMSNGMFIAFRGSGVFTSRHPPRLARGAHEHAVLPPNG